MTHGYHHPHPALCATRESGSQDHLCLVTHQLTSTNQHPPSGLLPAQRTEPPKVPKTSNLAAQEVWGLPSPGRSPLVCRIPVDRLQAEPRHQPQNPKQQQGPDSHTPRPRMGGPHDPAKAWGAGHQLPQSRSRPGGDCLGRPGYSARAAPVADAPSSHADRFLLRLCPPLQSAQPAGALPGAVCRRPMPPAHALAPRIGERA